MYWMICEQLLPSALFLTPHHCCPPPQEEYRAEGISWHNIDYIDNTGCINLISKKPTALLHLLDEECKYVSCHVKAFLFSLFAIPFFLYTSVLVKAIPQGSFLQCHINMCTFVPKPVKRVCSRVSSSS